MGDGAALGLNFEVEVDASSDLAFDDEQVYALVTVRARSAAGTPSGPPAAEVLIMDRSLSMSRHGKLSEAKLAMCAAVDAVREGTYLGIVAGHHEAEVIYPGGGGLARVDHAARAAAKDRILSQLPGGGTAIGTWLDCAERLFAAAPEPGAVRHAMLYTDGKDESETPGQLEAALARCADRFVCDARGLGEDWNYQDLLRITEALHGDARAVLGVADLTRDFVQLMESARRIVVPRVYLGLRLPNRFRLGSVRQTRPVEADLTAQQQRHGDETHVPLGSWAPEDRQYLVALRFDPDAVPVGEDVRAAVITLRAERPEAGREPCAAAQALVVRRRGTPNLPLRRPESHTRVENLRELGMAMRACADAHQGERYDEADRELRGALALATALGDAARLRLLHDVSVTGPDGRPQVRRDAGRGQMQRLGLESARTGALDAAHLTAPPAGSASRRVCPRCGTVTAGWRVRHCEECGHAFDEAGDDRGGVPEEPPAGEPGHPSGSDGPQDVL